MVFDARVGQHMTRQVPLLAECAPTLVARVRSCTRMNTLVGDQRVVPSKGFATDIASRFIYSRKVDLLQAFTSFLLGKDDAIFVIRLLVGRKGVTAANCTTTAVCV